MTPGSISEYLELRIAGLDGHLELQFFYSISLANHLFLLGLMFPALTEKIFKEIETHKKK